jgi:hypothetical protein
MTGWRGSLAVVAVSVGLLVPATADAEVLCVDGSGAAACPHSVKEESLQAALDKAEASPGPTEVILGPGPFTSSAAPGYSYAPGAANNPLTLRGAGPSTVLQGNEASNDEWRTLAITTVPGVANVVRDLKLVIPKKSSPSAAARDGLSMNSGTVENVIVEDRGDGLTGIAAGPGTVLRKVEVTMNPKGGAVLFAAAGERSVVEDAVLRGGTHGLSLLSGSVVTARRIDVTASYSVLQAYGGDLTVEDALLRVTGDDVFGGDGPAALMAETVAGKPASIDARRVTAIGPGNAQSDGARARSGDAGKTASIALDSSILSGFGASLRGRSFGGPFAITTRYSDYASATKAAMAGGTITEGEGNIDADPLFADPAASDFRLRAGSPAIDAGNPAPTASERDLRGDPRQADGNGDGTAIVDMGAFEAPAPPPSPSPSPITPPPVVDDGLTPPPDLAPSITGLRVRRTLARGAPRRAARHRAAFTLSEPAAVTLTLQRAVRGRRVAGRCRARAHTGRRCTRWVRVARVVRTLAAGSRTVLLPRRLARGRYRLTVAAVDAAGNRGAPKRLLFRVRR